MMKNKKLLIAALAACMTFAVSGLAACGGGGNDSASSGSQITSGSSQSETKKSVSLDQSNKTLDRYEAFTLTATIKDESGNTVGETATWESSDPSVASVENGVVQAKGVGTAVITASAGASSATCTVTVEDSGALPVLGVSDESVSLIEGGSYTVTGSVAYKRQEQEDAEISYSVSDSSVASVDANGKITALKYGEATLTVSAKWRGVESKFLTETIVVTVKEDVVIKIEDEEAVVYTASLEIDGQSFSNEITLAGSVKVRGSSDGVDASRMTWTSSDSTIASIDSTGKVTANATGKEGTAQITLSYRTENQTYTSQPITVSVLYPTVDKTEEICVDLDASKGTIKSQLTPESVFGAGTDKQVTRVYDTADAETDILENETWITEHDADTETERTTTITVYNAQYAYKIKALVVTKAISTYDELKRMQEYGGVEEVEKGAVTYWTYSGYFILSNDIVVPSDAGVFSAKCTGNLSSGSQIQDAQGFNGTFDGRGHTICGLKTGAGGLFGDIAKGTVIKNLALTDVVVSEAASANAGAGVLAYSFVGGAVENIFVSFETLQARSGIFGRATKDGVLKDAVIYYKKSGGYNNGAIAAWNVTKITYDNVYVVYAAGMAAADSKLVGEVESYGGTVTQIKEEALSSSSFDGLNEAWYLPEGGLPVFKSSIDDMGISNTSLTLKMGAEATLTAGVKNLAGTYISYMPVVWISSDENVATVENGVLTLLSVGETTITASCGIYTAECVLTVEKAEVPVQDKTAVTLDVEAAGSGTLAEQILAKAKAAGLFDEFAVTKIYLTDDASETDIKDNAAQAEGFFSDYDTGAEAARTKTLFVYGEEIAYKVRVLVVTKVIASYTELAGLQSYAKVTTGQNAGGATYYSYGGYFVLGGNLTAAGTEAAFSAPNMGSISSGGHSTNEAGFHGTFDGRGYTVKGFKYALGGVFGDIGKNAVIKNVSFEDCICDDVNYAGGETRVDGIGVLCVNANGNFLIDNVYCEASCNSPNGGGLFGRSIHSGTISNTVIRYNQTGGWSCGAIAGWGVYTAGTKLTNVYIILEGKADRVIGNVADNGALNVKADSTYTIVTKDEDPAAVTYTGLSETYWNVTAGAVPVFKSSAE